MKKDLAIIFGLFFLVIALLVFQKGVPSGALLRSNSPTSAARSQGKVDVAIGNLKIMSDVASTASDRKVGLSKKDSLPINSGMLFVFETSGPYAIWMKNMRFAIDIIWIDENKKVIDIVSEAPPEPGKSDKELTIYKPKAAAKYILEVNAGLVRLNNVNIGDSASFAL